MKSLPLALAASLLLLVAAAQGSPLEGSARASYTLLGLGSDLYGVHYDPSGWMLLAGQNGLIAYAEESSGAWRYRIVSYGGSELRSIAWSGGSGLVVGRERAVLVERHGSDLTVRDVPFLRGDYELAAWSMDKSFLVLLTSDGRAFAYRPGEPAAYEVPIPSGGAVKLLVESSSRVEGAPYALAVAEREAENQEISEVLAIGYEGAREVGDDSPEPLRSLARLLLEALEKYPGLRGRAILIPSEGGLGSLVLFSGNIVEVYGGSRIALAFDVLGAAGSGGRVVAVGRGGGVAIVDVASGDVRYVSIPSSERVFFIDADTAAVTSPSGLFLYSFSTGSVEYIPMPSRPTSLLPAEGLVADEGGRIFRLIRPAPWKGGLSLVATLDSGYVADMAKLGGQVMLLVAGTKPEKTRLMLLGPSGLRTLPEASKLQDAELVRAASLGEAAVLAGPGGIFYVSSGGQPVRLGGSEAGATAASWHPEGCVCLVTGRGGRLFGILDGQLLPIPAETSRDLVSAAWGDGYALVGGSGVLYLFDGYRLTELEAPHVTTWQSIAYRGSGEFLASTPLGLMLIKTSYSPARALDAVLADHSTTAGGEHRVTIVVIAHEGMEVKTVRPEGPAVVTDWSGPRRLAPGCPATITASLKPMEDKSLGTTVRLYLDTDGGSFELAALDLAAPSQAQQSAAGNPIAIVAIAAGAIAAIAVVVARRRSRRAGEEPRGEPNEEAGGEAQGGEARKDEQGRGDLEEEYWGRGGVWD
jgi:hypothetical protein